MARFKKTISCIIPTRDRRLMVREAIGSVLEQELPVDEIVVVDDGSRDNTAMDLRRLFPKVRLVQTVGLGPGPARNAGARASSGDILMFLDSDDCWLPHHSRLLAETLAGAGQVSYGVTATDDLVGGGGFLIPEHGRGPTGNCLPALSRWCFLVPSALAVERKLFEAVGGFGAEDFAEDWALFIRLAGRAPFAFAGGEPITRRRLHAGSLCARADPERIARGVSHLATLFAAQPGAEPADSARLAQLAAWTAANKKKWQTVQAWYTALRREGLL